MSSESKPQYEIEFPPYQKSSETSFLAAASVQTTAPTQRNKVYACIRERGKRGATADEVGLALNLPAQAVTARIWELHHKQHLIKRSGERRLTRYGKRADVYVVTDES